MTNITTQQRNDLIAIRNSAGLMVKAGVIEAYQLVEIATKLLESTVAVEEDSVCRTDSDGDKFWRNKAGLWHRDNDLPAIIWADGTKEWWVDGQLHRDNDLPAVIHPDGNQEWWVNGRLHRLNDLPAVIRADGTQQWWVNGIRRTPPK